MQNLAFQNNNKATEAVPSGVSDLDPRWVLKESRERLVTTVEMAAVEKKNYTQNQQNESYVRNPD